MGDNGKSIKSKLRLFCLLSSLFFLASIFLANSIYFSYVNIETSNNNYFVDNMKYNKDRTTNNKGLSIPPYHPIEEHFTSSSYSKDISDEFHFNHPFVLYMNSSNLYTDSFIAEDIVGYDHQFLYNVTEMKSTKDQIKVVSTSNSDYKLPGDSDYGLAQSFQVNADYVRFYGVDLILSVYIDGELGDKELELFLTNATADDKPNLDNILSTAISSYNESNYSSLDGTRNYYDFNDVTLTRGRYFIIANLSVTDSDNNTCL